MSVAEKPLITFEEVLALIHALVTKSGSICSELPQEKLTPVESKSRSRCIRLCLIYLGHPFLGSPHSRPFNAQGNFHIISQNMNSCKKLVTLKLCTSMCQENLCPTRKRSLAIPAVLKVLQKESLTPHLLVSPQVEGEFAHLFSNQTLPNCVVLGDAGNAFSFEALNKAFRAIKTMPSPRLFALGCGKYYRHKGELHLDVGPFMSALEYATGVQAEVIGKPAKEFFKAALSDLEVNAEEVSWCW
ncbi:phospholysine phosphohistidine inorganic pyrophosphate phosphatase-like [Portunus trituberculatus]|uniref:phospholysine phosphohistidine inorganic pyrophosphate phosphatase-like n=1 Tax=Portunus trituberculatus TaxID=210409 RepID=UPI001E1CEFD6|nr:phospholysine phosphohistidine inorganic pyrophosphate phosphatase-like [Portunus trituberculatus]